MQPKPLYIGTLDIIMLCTCLGNTNTNYRVKKLKVKNKKDEKNIDATIDIYITVKQYLPLSLTATNNENMVHYAS